MIGRLEGTVRAIRLPAQTGGGFCILSAGGVGYKVYGTKETLGSLTEGGEADVWIHTAVREDVLDLYGFEDEEALHLFEQLLTVGGIGPKSALGILDIASVETLRSAIAGGNDSYLTKVSGIGKKTAAKIVLELKDKVGKASDERARSLGGEEEALEAMRSLGYSLQESRDALRKVPASVQKSSERLREAIKLLGSR